MVKVPFLLRDEIDSSEEYCLNPLPQNHGDSVHKERASAITSLLAGITARDRSLPNMIDAPYHKGQTIW